MTTRGTYGILWLGWFVVLLYQIWPTDFQQNLKADQPSLRLQTIFAGWFVAWQQPRKVAMLPQQTRDQQSSCAVILGDSHHRCKETTGVPTPVEA